MVSASLLLIPSRHTSTQPTNTIQVLHSQTSQELEPFVLVNQEVASLKLGRFVVVVATMAELGRPLLKEPPANRARGCIKSVFFFIIPFQTLSGFM